LLVGVEFDTTTKDMNKKKTVFVGVSGGVDSSVSAQLLKEAGYTVVGVFIRTWTPDFIECTWRDERRDAMRVCAHLNIPFLECDAEDAYKKGVADYMIEEYKKGNTPNPDVMCNREVKFGVFWNFAKSHGADYIATGHYAINDNGLRKGNDDSKDQSYFLWTLTKEDLAHTLFPIGHLEKSEVRKLAEKYNLPTAQKKDSQGVCFLGPLDMKDFLKHYIESHTGDVVDLEGNIIGTHDGAVFFTLGERHGFTLSKHSNNDVPLYVASKDIKKNTITVSSELEQNNKDIYSYELRNVNWIKIPEENIEYTAQIRYHGEQLLCTISVGDKAIVTFDKPVLVSRGQSIVVYDNNLCLGGGVVV
jgi:tRNA-uridine 2-sulfurtransferase